MGHSWLFKNIEDPSAAPHPQQVLPCDGLPRKNSGNPTDDLFVGATASVVAVQPERHAESGDVCSLYTMRMCICVYRYIYI